MTPRFSRRIFFAMAVLSASTATVRGDFKKLLDRIPPNANAIVVVDLERVMNSPLAKKENWKEMQADAYAEKPMVVPPGATRLITAAMINTATLSPVWEVSVMDLSKAPSLEAIAAAEHGFVDNVGGKRAVWSPINAYFIELDAKVLGALSPANRQFAARWARGQTVTGSPYVSDYLKAAVLAVGDDAEFLMALDLQDVTSARQVRAKLANQTFDSLAEKEMDENAVARVVASIKGVTLKVNLAAAAMGTLSIDFGKDAAPLKDIAKGLFLEFLDRAGAEVPDFAKWQFSAKGTSIVAHGRLSTESLRNLYSVVNPPAPSEASTSGESPTAKKTSASTGAMATASKKYYKAVSTITDKIGSDYTSSPSMGKFATWMRRDAQRINRLPILNVDPALIAWGTEVSDRLSKAAQVFTVGGLSAESQTAGVNEGYTELNYDAATDSYQTGARDVDRRNLANQRKQVAKAEAARTAAAAGEVFNGLREISMKVRAEMTAKYKTEF